MPKKWSYSEIVTEFYQIGLSEQACVVLNVHFCGAAHNYIRWSQSTTKEHKQHHKRNYLLHMKLLKALVYRFGDFSNSADPSKRGNNLRSTWQEQGIPDPKMFNSMREDDLYPVGASHPFDEYLFNESWLNYFTTGNRHILEC